MQLSFLQGDPSAKNSLAQLINPSTNAIYSKSIAAGTTVRWVIYPFDAALNPLTIDVNVDAMAIKYFTVSYLTNYVTT